jgi:hypothetical protein
VYRFVYGWRKRLIQCASSTLAGDKRQAGVNNCLRFPRADDQLMPL